MLKSKKQCDKPHMLRYACLSKSSLTHKSTPVSQDSQALPMMTSHTVSKITERLCVACREKFDREKLIRLLQDHKTGETFINPDQFKFGRSVYVCKNESCIIKFLKNKRYKDKFKKEELIEQINNK